jgi:hypothetical protein
MMYPPSLIAPPGGAVLDMAARRPQSVASTISRAQRLMQCADLGWIANSRAISAIGRPDC